MRAYTSENMRLADKLSEEKYGISPRTLIKNAGKGLYCALESFMGKGKSFAVLCGKGNNGADGYALAALLAGDFERVVCVSVLTPNEDSHCWYFHSLCTDMNIPVLSADEAIEKMSEFDVITDAIFGTGFSGEISEESPIGGLIAAANESRAYRLSADAPSGACADTGRVSGACFRADKTVSFAGAKVGLYSYPAKEFCGEITLCPVGIPEEILRNIPEEYTICDEDYAFSLLPERKENSSKGDFGRALIYAGSENMTGAARLCLDGCLRTGAGLVTLASDREVIRACQAGFSEPVYLPLDDTDTLIERTASSSVILAGCGIGRSETAKETVHRIIKESLCPIILDADGINAISDNINILSEAKSEILLTPHPLEFSRISGYGVQEINGNRIGVARQFARQYGVSILLKGAGTVICDKYGRVWVNTSGSSALAKGGSGDVLAGMICGLVCGGASLVQGAVCGAYLHGAAAQYLEKKYSRYGVLPSQLATGAARLIAKRLYK